MAEYSESQRFDMWSDTVFATLFIVCFCVVLILSFKAFKSSPAMINLPNLLVVIFLLLTLASKFPLFHIASQLTD